MHDAIHPIQRIDLWEEVKPQQARLDQLHVLLGDVFTTLSGIVEFTEQLEQEGVRLFGYADQPYVSPAAPPTYHNTPFVHMLWYAANDAVEKLYYRRVSADNMRGAVTSLQNMLTHASREKNQASMDRLQGFLDDMSSLHDGRLKMNLKSDHQSMSVLCTMTIVGLLYKYGLLDQVVVSLQRHITSSTAQRHETLQYVYFHITSAFFAACNAIVEERRENLPMDWVFPLVMQRTHDYIVSSAFFQKSRENVLMMHSVSNVSDYIVGKGGEFKSRAVEDETLHF